jgi:hypothetical protein
VLPRWSGLTAHAPCPITPPENRYRMTNDPQHLDRVFRYAKKAVWLLMAYAFGSMVGHLILLAR